ncbi:hypothetical protein [Sphaerisporangium sp. TRM90804]|nr:hypothetical protein [Sphaerisporangium sp. TRM90804]
MKVALGGLIVLAAALGAVGAGFATTTTGREPAPPVCTASAP